VKDEKTERPLADSEIEIISSDGIVNKIQTNANGAFTVTLKAGTDYVFLASKQGYLKGKERETTRGYDRSKNFTIEIKLVSVAKPIEVPNIFYDFAKWDLRPESMVSLDKLVETLNDNPNITIELGSHTDARGSEQGNNELSQKRAQSVVNYLIEKGIARDRLTAKGYGKSTPKVVDEAMSEQYPFLRNGIALTEAYINSLSSTDEQEVAHQFNRRAEFKVLRTDYR
jgi:peptidoglycan-associated lipoprotein